LSFIPDSYHYLVINLLTIAYPLAQSYEHRLRFLQNWKAIFLSIAVSGGVFLAWDELFTQLGVWGFNTRYLTGLYIGELPIEEYGFFLTVPFACLFVFEVLNYFVKPDILGKFAQSIAWFFILVTFILGVFFYPRLYTAICFFFASALLSFTLLVVRPDWLGRFFLSYGVCLIPMFIMNGWLTGWFTDEPIVWYSDEQNMGIRIGTIPAEDFVYQMAYFLLVMLVYNKNRKLKSPRFHHS
jgi:lycopene cyclase domain-containing protein